MRIKMSPWTVLGWMAVVAFTPAVLMSLALGAALVVGTVARTREEREAREYALDEIERHANEALNDG